MFYDLRTILQRKDVYRYSIIPNEQRGPEVRQKVGWPSFLTSFFYAYRVPYVGLVYRPVHFPVENMNSFCSFINFFIGVFYE